jgi:antirestriction protein ArdC
MMIALQCPQATHVAGYTTWQKLGRHVKQGERGIAILAPMLHRLKIKGEDAEEEARTAQVVRGFKVVHVFDVSQTDGTPLPEFAKISGDPGIRLAQLHQLVADEGIRLEYDRLPGGVLGRSLGGEITLVPGLQPAEEFSVLVHELAHELLHRGERRQQTNKTVRETEAEAVSFVVSRAIGLDCSTRSSDYIQLYAGDVKVLSESLEHIQRAATKILSALEVSPTRQQLPVET